MTRLLVIICIGIGLACVGWLTAANSISAQSSQLMNVASHLPDLRFALIDDNGQPVTQKSYRGNVALLYFGFTGCGAQCPLTMARLTEIIRRLGSEASRTRVLFVTVNPANDTPQVLHRYLGSFEPQHMTGLTGNENEIEALAQRLRAAYRPVSAGDIAHSNAIYIFDSAGHARLLATPEDTDEEIIHDLRQLIHAT